MPAVKARIIEVVDGRFFQGSKDELTPSYIVDGFGRKIVRTNMIASLVEKYVNADGSYVSFTIDDGSGQIRVKAFGEDVKKYENFKPGEEILVIGKVRQYKEELYIMPEVMKVVENMDYVSLRRLEILREMSRLKEFKESIKKIANVDGKESARNYVMESTGLSEEEAGTVLSSAEKKGDKKDSEEIVFKIICEMDEGNGVDLNTILEKSKLDERDVETVVTKLLEEGAVFEPNLGKFKSL